MRNENPTNQTVTIPTKTKSLEDQIRVRPASQNDVHFIFNSWLKTCRASRAFNGVPSAVYYAEQHKVIEGLLRRGIALIASSHTDPDHIFGYAIAEIVEDVPVVHFVYIKDAYRKLGLATLLLKSAQIDPSKPFFYTHDTRIGASIAENKTLVYNPFLAYSAHTEATKNEQQ